VAEAESAATLARRLAPGGFLEENRAGLHSVGKDHKKHRAWAWWLKRSRLQRWPAGLRRAAFWRRSAPGCILWGRTTKSTGRKPGGWSGVGCNAGPLASEQRW